MLAIALSLATTGGSDSDATIGGTDSDAVTGQSDFDATTGGSDSKPKEAKSSSRKPVAPSGKLMIDPEEKAGVGKSSPVKKENIELEGADQLEGDGFHQVDLVEGELKLHLHHDGVLSELVN